MSWRCFFLGCQWRTLLARRMGGDVIECKVCSRCHAHRYVTAKKSPR